MKTLNLLVISTIAVMVLASCEEEPILYQGQGGLVGQVGQENRTPANIEFFGELSCNSFAFENGTLVEFCGDCSCTKGPGYSANINIQGDLDLNTNENTFKLADGMFELAGRNSSGYLSGEIITSQGLINDDHLQITGYIEVRCGTGCFEANCGGIDFLIEGPVGNEDLQASVYTLEMSGHIN